MTTTKEGARFLDEVRPNWYHDINIYTLDMRNSTRCILGQLYNTYSNALTQLNLTGYQVIPFSSSGNKEEWLTEIKTRRNKMKEESINNFSWAVEQMKNGRFARRKCWSSNLYILNRGGQLAYPNYMYSPLFEDIEATDWECYNNKFCDLAVGDKFKLNGRICNKTSETTYDRVEHVNTNNVNFLVGPV